MPVFMLVIIFSLSFYIYFKIKSIRTKKPNEKKWISGKSSIALGIFVLFFGINTIFMMRSTLSIIIGFIFIIIGALTVYGGHKVYKHFLPLAFDEAKN